MKKIFARADEKFLKTIVCHAVEDDGVYKLYFDEDGTDGVPAKIAGNAYRKNMLMIVLDDEYLKPIACEKVNDTEALKFTCAHTVTAETTTTLGYVAVVTVEE